MIETAPPKSLRVGVLTVSDRAAGGVYEDRGGPAVRAYFEEKLPDCEVHARVVPDDLPRVAGACLELLAAGCRLVVATGGTGPAARDVTPEALAPLLEKELPGFGEKMRADAWARKSPPRSSPASAAACGGTR